MLTLIIYVIVALILTAFSFGTSTLKSLSSDTIFYVFGIWLVALILNGIRVAICDLKKNN